MAARSQSEVRADSRLQDDVSSESRRPPPQKDKVRRRDPERRLRQAERLARVLRVLQLIQGRGRYDAAALAAEQECSVRTVFRDLTVLELAGVPWYFDNEQDCYRVQPDFRFPPLNLSDEELLGQA